MGSELTGKLEARETGHGTCSNGTAWAMDTDRGGGLPSDGCLRADATAWCGQMGTNASYSHGFANVQAGLYGWARARGLHPYMTLERSLPAALANQTTVKDGDGTIKLRKYCGNIVVMLLAFVPSLNNCVAVLIAPTMYHVAGT